MASFASVDDMETRLGVTYTGSEIAQAQAFLDDATAFLQAEIGQLITAGTATYTTRHRGDSPLHLPQQPVTAVTAVEIDGTALTSDEYDLVDQELHLPPRWSSGEFGEYRPYMDVTVAFTYGYTTVPAELKAWCIVLASQQMTAAAGGSLGIPGVRSESIDDYSVTYVTDGSTMTLPREILDRLRARYGTGAYVTGVGR